MVARRVSYCTVVPCVIELLFTFCVTASADVIAGGSSSSYKVMKALASAFEAQSNIAVTVQGGGSSQGAEDCIAGRVQIGLLARDLKDSETSNGLISHRYALDGVAVIVHPQNAVNGTTIEELKSIYTGTSHTLGGSKVIPYNRPRVSGTRGVFQSKVLGNNATFSDRLEIATPKAGVAIVSASPTALYYTSAGDNLETVKILKVDGLLPTRENLRLGRYRLSRPLIMATRGQPAGEVKQFIDFVLSPDGQEIVKTQGFALP